MVSVSNMAGAPQYAFARSWGIGAEMFGEIEDLSHAGRLTTNPTALAPRFSIILQSTPRTRTGTTIVAKAHGMEFALNVGVQFGLTDATSDTALKFQGSLAF